MHNNLSLYTECDRKVIIPAKIGYGNSNTDLNQNISKPIEKLNLRQYEPSSKFPRVLD